MLTYINGIDHSCILMETIKQPKCCCVSVKIGLSIFFVLSCLFGFVGVVNGFPDVHGSTAKAEIALNFGASILFTATGFLGLWSMFIQHPNMISVTMVAYIMGITCYVVKFILLMTTAGFKGEGLIIVVLFVVGFSAYVCYKMIVYKKWLVRLNSP